MLTSIGVSLRSVGVKTHCRVASSAEATYAASASVLTSWRSVRSPSMPILPASLTVVATGAAFDGQIGFTCASFRGA